MAAKRSAVAIRYARAISSSNQQELEAILAELDGLLQQLAEEPSLWGELNNLGITPMARLDRIRENRPGLSAEMLALLRLIIEHHRLALLPEIVSELRKLHLEHTGRMQLTVTSAVPLTDDQLGDLQTALARRFGRAVILQSVIAPGILGGLIITGEAWELDLSLRTRLTRLQRQLETGELLKN